LIKSKIKEQFVQNYFVKILIKYLTTIIIFDNIINVDNKSTEKLWCNEKEPDGSNHEPNKAANHSISDGAWTGVNRGNA
jgi:hypothetical protein